MSGGMDQGHEHSSVGMPAPSLGRWQLEMRMEVTGSDAVTLGRVKEVRDSDFLLDRAMQRDIYVPFAAVQEVTDGRVVLTIPARQVTTMGWPRSPLRGLFM